MKDHSFYLNEDLKQAIKAESAGQNPIGCVIVDENGKIIVRAHNQVAERNDKTAHAEMLALKKAARFIKDENIRQWTLYTTMEPCVMCLGTIIMTHVGTVVWWARDRLIETHKLLSASPFMRTRSLKTVAYCDTEVGRQCQEINDNFWISQGRAEKVQPIVEPVSDSTK
jgi:tRNA(adenine34) deaminase